MCDSNRNFGNVDANRDYPITRVPAVDLARYQIYAIDSVTGQNIPDPRLSGNNDNEASTSNQVSVTQAEWDAAQRAVVNNTRLPLGVSAGTLNAYHSILEKNISLLNKEHIELIRRREAADASSQRRAELSAIRSSGSHSLNSRYRPRIPRLSEADAAGITRDLASSFMTVDTAGLLRPKNAEATTAQLAAYLVGNPPAPDDPRSAEHRVALESLGIIGNRLIAPAAAPAPAPAPVPAAPAPPLALYRHSSPDRSPHRGSGHRRDARDDITQQRIDKARRQRSNRIGFERYSSEEAPDGCNRGAKCFHYRIREAMPPRRFKPTPTDADKYDGQIEPKTWIEDYLQNVIILKGNEIAAMQCFQLYLKDSARAWLRTLLAGSIRSWDDLVDVFVKNF